MSNPATTTTNCPTQKHKVPKYFKGNKVAKHPDLITVSVLIVLFILFYVLIRIGRAQGVIQTIQQRSETSFDEKIEDLVGEKEILKF